MSADIIFMDFHAMRAAAREDAEDRLGKAAFLLHVENSKPTTPERLAAMQAAVDEAAKALREIGADAGYLRSGE